MAWGDTDEGGFGEFGGVDAADWGGGDKQSDWSSIIDAMRGLFGARQSNMGTIPRHSNAYGFVGGDNAPYGTPRHSNAHGFVGGGNVPQSPYSSPFQSGWGNVDAMTGAYGPGSPVDPMSGGMGNRQGPAWGPGIGYGPYNVPRGPTTGIFGPPGTRRDLDIEEMEYGGGM